MLITSVLIVVAVLALLVAVPAYIGFATHNRLVALDQRCETAFGDIDVHLKHRHSLIPPLVETVRALAERFAPAIVVVDDGSGPEYRDVFATVAAMPGVQVVRHATNLGKGAALKTGIDHALRVFPGLIGIVTADADGQHRPEDIEAVARTLLSQPAALVLGCRAFGGGVPLRSRLGNIATRVIVYALLGRKLIDTQTGLRGIPSSLLTRLLEVESNGYEFELEMLIAARRLSVPIVELPIRTIYEAGNQSSHFNPVIDSMKIYFVLLRFSSVSLMTAALDNLVYIVAWRHTANILGAQVAGRVLAVAFNYWMVRRSVFHERQGSPPRCRSTWGWCWPAGPRPTAASDT